MTAGPIPRRGANQSSCHRLVSQPPPWSRSIALESAQTRTNWTHPVRIEPYSGNRVTIPTGGADYPGIIDDVIRPYRLAISEDAIDDLDDRLNQTRWANPLAGEPWARGVPVACVWGLTEYWRDGYDWRGAEAEIN